MSPSKICMLLGIISLSSGLTAQKEQDSTKVLSANSRVERCLNALQKQASFSFECSLLKNSSQNIIIQMGGMGGGKKKPKPSIVEGTKQGPILSWSKDDGEEVIANQGRNWVSLDRDGDWVPSRKPVGSWADAHLADPVFLAARLKHLLKESKWESKGTTTIDEKALRLYRVELEPETAVHLVRSGAIPANGGLFGGIGRMIVFRGIGGGAGRLMPEPETTVEILLYEDPATHRPVKMTLNIFTEQGIGGPGMRVVIGGMGGGGDYVDDEDDEDNKKEKKKKPGIVLSISFAAYGKAKAKDLSAEALSILSGKKKGI